MKNITPVFVFHSLNVGRGGLTKSLMQRANTLVKHFHDVVFLTFTYQKRHKEIIQRLYENEELDARVRVENYFLDRQEPATNETLTEWVTEKINDMKYPVLMSDSHHSHEVVMNVPTKNVRKIAMLHGNHLNKPFHRGCQVRSFLQPLFDNFHHFDRVVVLTEQQKSDIIHDYGHADKIQVIPHPVPNTEKKTIDTDPHLAVSASRLHWSKYLNESIHAFKYVVEKISNARYEIYGTGPKQGDLQRLIDKLGLQDNIKLMGYTDNANLHFQRAACSLVTSDREGFAMTLTESMSNGTPVVTYDFKYGPQEIIRHEYDGFIVPRGDRQQMAERIMSIMEIEPLREHLSKHALEVSQRFSFETYEKQWVHLMKKVHSRLRVLKEMFA